MIRDLSCLVSTTMAVHVYRSTCRLQGTPVGARCMPYLPLHLAQGEAARRKIVALRQQAFLQRSDAEGSPCCAFAGNLGVQSGMGRQLHGGAAPAANGWGGAGAMLGRRLLDGNPTPGPSAPAGGTVAASALAAAPAPNSLQRRPDHAALFLSSFARRRSSRVAMLGVLHSKATLEASACGMLLVMW